MGKLIYGIQQIGVGVSCAQSAFKWYAQKLGADIMVFDNSNEATDMAPYMGGQAHKKRALMSINLNGGSGYEFWQYLDKEPIAASEPNKLGDLGINFPHIKSHNIQKSYERLKSNDVNVISEILTEPDGKKCFYIKDLNQYVVKIKEHNSWFSRKNSDVGGVFGSTIGVSDIDKSMQLYSEVLGYDQVVFDDINSYDDFKSLNGGEEKFRRVILRHKNRGGGFSTLYGSSELELIELKGSPTKKIFQDRHWGDLGYIHLCFDIFNMDQLVKECKDNGTPFTVLSQPTFDMGDAHGHFGYIEDPDGTLIEFVETRKLSLSKKFNFNINLTNRDPNKPLPRWLISAMRIKRAKF